MRSIGIVVMVALMAPQPGQQKLTDFAGGWTLNKNPIARRGPGGFGGPIGGGFGVPTGRGSREQIALQREALRDITDPPAHLIIVVTNTIVILTGPDGRTTRLSPDGKKIKDDNTKVERKTRWTAGKLITEIEGLGPTITQTYALDMDRRQLRLTAEVAASRPNEARTVTHIYDADAR